MPLKKDKVLLLISIVGAVASLVANMLITKRLQSVGSAIILLGAEVIVTLIYTIFIRRNIGIRVPITPFFREAVLSVPSAAVAIIAVRCIGNPFVALAVGGTLSVAVWGVVHIKSLRMIWR